MATYNVTVPLTAEQIERVRYALSRTPSGLPLGIRAEVFGLIDKHAPHPIKVGDTVRHIVGSTTTAEVIGVDPEGETLWIRGFGDRVLVAAHNYIKVS